MTLDHANVTFDYTKIENAVWIDEEATAAEYTFDGGTLVPLRRNLVSPFMDTFFLPADPELFMVHQSHRIRATEEFWPIIERARTHLHRNQSDYFDQEMRALGYERTYATARERHLALAEATTGYGRMFGAPESDVTEFTWTRIDRARKQSPSAVEAVIQYFLGKSRHRSLDDELHHIRKQWARLVPLLLPLYHVYYWDEEKHSLDSYTIAQKRLAELKPLYVDCFETFCRISAVAAAIEGVIATSQALVPTSKGSMTIEEFELMANGSKPGVLKNLPIADLFVPYINSQLRNGMGHNAAQYKASSDSVEYVNENRSGQQRHTISYVRLCETVTRLYGQLESVAPYANWLSIESV